jgi:hypothetical protein
VVDAEVRTVELRSHVRATDLTLACAAPGAAALGRSIS